MKYKSIVIISFLILLVHTKAHSYENAQSHPCLKCHSNQTISFNNSVTGKIEKRLMNPYYILRYDCTKRRRS